MIAMRNKSGFSLVELLVSIIVASILILTISVLSGTANSSFNKLNSEQQIYNDISYGFKLLQNKVRVASSIAVGDRLSPWISGQHFLIDSGVFGLCQYSFSAGQCQAGGTQTALVYDDGVKQDTILRVPSSGTIALTFPAALTSTSVTISISGNIIISGLTPDSQDNIPFNVQTTAMRRNP